MKTTEYILRAWLRTADLAGLTLKKAADAVGISVNRMERNGNYKRALHDERVRRCVVNGDATTTELMVILGLKCRTAIRDHYRAAWGKDPGRTHDVTTCPRDDAETIMDMYRAGTPMRKLAHQTGYSETQIYKWIATYKQRGPSAFVPREAMR